eukprot:scaffold320608_cov30-Tisochrysis_lutea.AAC.3
MLHLDSCCEDRLETTLPETSLVAGQEYWGPERVRHSPGGLARNHLDEIRCETRPSIGSPAIARIHGPLTSCALAVRDRLLLILGTWLRSSATFLQSLYHGHLFRRIEYHQCELTHLLRVTTPGMAHTATPASIRISDYPGLLRGRGCRKE